MKKILLIPVILLIAVFAKAQTQKENNGKKSEAATNLQNNNNEQIAPAENTNANLSEQELIELQNKHGIVTGIYKYEQPKVPVDKEKIERKEESKIADPK